jgi:hypothetical protein
MPAWEPALLKKGGIMKPFMILALACAVSLGMSTAGIAEDPVGRADTNILPQAEIRGEVLKVDGDTYLVRDDRTKKEVKFTLEKDVKASLERPLKQGDRIEAFVTPEGYAKTVRIDGPKGRDVESSGKDVDKATGDVGKAGKDIGEIQAPGGFSKEIPASGKKGGQ